MKKLILLISLFICQWASASHTMGAELTYKLIDTAVGVYKFQLIVYRDCSGINFGNETITIQSSSQNLSLPMSLIGKSEITPLCPGATSNCPGPSPATNIKGSEAWVYEVTTTIGKNIGWAMAYWNSCCRNSSISNISSPGSQGITVQTVFNTNYLNNSTVFSNKKMPYWCNGRLNSYSFAALDESDIKFIDINGVNVIRDSIVYEQYTPFIGVAANPNAAALMQNPTVSFIAPLNSQNFIYTTTGVSFDKNTGILSATPSIMQEACAGVVVKEFRAVPNGSGGYTRVMISYTMRDIQFMVGGNCANPSASSYSATGNVGLGVVNNSTYSAVGNSSKYLQLTIEVDSNAGYVNAQAINTFPNGIVGNFNFNYFMDSFIYPNGKRKINCQISFDSIKYTGNQIFNFEVYFCTASGLKISNIHSVNFNLTVGGYCTSIADTNKYNHYTYIRNVSTTGASVNISNTSACNSLVGSQGTAAGVAGRYADYSNSTVPKLTVNKGSSFTLNVKDSVCQTGFAYYTIVAFADWNQDYDFDDAGERINMSSNPYNTPNVTKTITVPTNASLGTTRMRIITRMDTGASNINPCGDPTFKWSGQGETEDYAIQVNTCNGNLATNNTDTSAICKPGSKALSGSPAGGTWSLVNTFDGSIIGNTYNTGANLAIGITATVRYSIAANGNCPASTSDRSFVVHRYQSATITFTSDTICSYATKTLSATPTGGTWQLISGVGTINGNVFIAGTVTSPTYTTIQYIYNSQNGACPAVTTSKSFWVNPCANCNITTTENINNNICFGSDTGYISVFPSGGIAPYKYLWSTGDSTYYISKLTAGTYNLTITDSAGCIKTKSFTINQSPALTLTLAKGTNFINSSVSGGTAPYYYTWIYNGSYIPTNTSSLTNAQPGTYCLSVRDAKFCSVTICDTIFPSNPCQPYKNFTYTVNPTSGQVQFANASLPAGYTSNVWWGFGNNHFSYIKNPTNIYTSSGTYSVGMGFCILDSSGNQVCCDSVTKYVTVSVPVVIPCNITAKFGWTASSPIGALQFIDSSSPTNQMYTYLWNFGDGTTSNQKNPYKVYAANGTYTVCLVVRKWANSNNMVCQDSICKSVAIFNVNPCNKLFANFNYSVVNGAYVFTNSTNMTGLNPVSIKYTISPTNTIYNHDSAAHTFAKDGYVNVCMTISAFDPTTGVTCTKSTCKYIYITNSICGCLNSNFTYSKVINTTTYNFINTSTCVDTNTTYFWNFGNGATASTKNATNSYSTAGFYKVVMYATKGNCVDSSVRYIQIYMTDPCHDSGYVNNITNCYTYINPVCGCDSMTYLNSCFAYKNGVKKYRFGVCNGDTNYVKICGYVYNDLNRNCFADSNDLPIKNTRLVVNTIPASYLYTNAQGYYSIYLPKGTYSINQLYNNTNYVMNQVCPASNGSITVNANVGGITYCNNDFFDTMNTCNDLLVTRSRFRNICPGFPNTRYIYYKNLGGQSIANVKVHYRFLAALIPLTTSTAGYTVSGNVISWNVGTLAPYSNGMRVAVFQTPTTLPLGTATIDSIWIESDSTDCNLTNNSVIYNDTCKGSWDPNDKTASPDAGDITKETKVIDYHVRFQNTGTAPAHNVVITDEIDNSFDRSSLVINGASHAYSINFKDDGKLYVEFDNIMLPDSGTDYEASQGYVDYSVRLKPNLSVGTKLNNTAAIYFDYNDPVITNTTTHTIVLKSTQGITNVGQDMNISIFPNPTQDKAILKINLDKSSQIAYSIFDLNGKQIISKELKKSADFSDEINLESMAPGIYILNISINGKVNSFKVVKE